MNEKLCAEYDGGVEARPSLLRQREVKVQCAWYTSSLL